MFLTLMAEKIPRKVEFIQVIEFKETKNSWTITKRRFLKP